MKLIENWRQAWRMLSVQLAALIPTIALVEPALPQLREYLPEQWYAWLAVAVIVARVISQPKLGVDDAARQA